MQWTISIMNFYPIFIPKSTFQFSHFYANQLFSVDSKMYRNTSFVFVLHIKDRKPPSKVGIFEKLQKLYFSTAGRPKTSPNLVFS